MKPVLRSIIRWLSLAALPGALVLQPVNAAQAAQDFSEAEQALFMRNQLATLKPPLALRYRFKKSGQLEPGFDDTVTITLSKLADGSCCAARAQFFSGPRELKLPEIEAALGNPVLLYFLERDIREMQRLTKGQPNYFRKRIRLAIYGGAQIRNVSVAVLGRDVAAREITVSPYLDDPLRARFEKFATKQYIFTLSDAVPGGVVALRTRIGSAAADADTLLSEVLQFDGTSTTAPKPSAPALRTP